MKRYFARLAFPFMISALIIGHATQTLAKTKTKKTPEPVPASVPEMRIDPSLMKSYQQGVAIESERVERSGVQVVAIEPAIEMHQFSTFYVHNDYFEIPLNGGSKSAMAPSVWVGNPTGAVWSQAVRVRAGIEMAYLGYDGAQSVHQRAVHTDFKDNISAHVLPVLATVRFGRATYNNTWLGVSPWFSVGAGTMLTQVSGSLDGTSQSAWSPITKAAGGLRFASSDQHSILSGVSVGLFRISGASKKAEWRGNGLSLGVDVLL